MTIELSADEARRISLEAQGFSQKAAGKTSIRHVREVAKRLGALQLDTVNVLVRSHYLPAFSRTGPYSKDALDRLVNHRHEVIEIDAHQASFIPVELEPLFRRRRGARFGDWSGWRRQFELKRPGYIDAVEREVVERGPLGLSDLADPGRREKPKASQLAIRRRDGKPYAESSVLWWRSSDGKEALEGLVAEGRLAYAGRTSNFERLYDVADRVIPLPVRNTPAPSEEEERREIVSLAAKALGVATVADLANYFQIKVAAVRFAARELVDRGDLLPARVESWKAPAFLHPGVRSPKAIEARALLSPFDSLTWSRDRTRRLFEFDFSFEIYLPEKKRKYGYYVLPFLLGDRLVARVDLKADRARGVLLAPGAFAEGRLTQRALVPDLAEAVKEMAEWLELERVEVGDRGDLTGSLRRALSRP